VTEASPARVHAGEGGWTGRLSYRLCLADESRGRVQQGAFQCSNHVQTNSETPTHLNVLDTSFHTYLFLPPFTWIFGLLGRLTILSQRTTLCCASMRCQLQSERERGTHLQRLIVVLCREVEKELFRVPRVKDRCQV
jgi:hypothetical protein